MRFHILSGAALALCAAGAQAAVYRWVDKNGGVHYTQTAPPAEQVQAIKPPPPTGSDSSGLKKYSDDYNKTQAEKAKAQAAADATGKQRAANCATARGQLETLQNMPLHRLAVEGENGNVTRMTPEQQQQATAAAQATVTKNCDAP